MNVTNNLKLPQYTEEDIFDLQDINKAYDSIDKAYGNIDDTYKEVVNIKDEIPKTNATAEVINARGGKETLGERLDEFSSQLDTNAKLVEDLSINIKAFGAKCNGIDSDDVAIQSAIDYLKEKGGGTLLIPRGTAIITKTLVIDSNAIYIKGTTPYKSIIKCVNTFNGTSAIYFKRNDEVWANKGIGIDGLTIDCNSLEIDGLKVEKAYDQSKWSNIEVINVHPDNIAFNFTQPLDSLGGVGQTLLLENCIGYHCANNPTEPVYKFTNYQEITLIGCKAFSSLADNDTIFTSGDCFQFLGCLGVTMIGCSNAFCLNGIVIKGNNKMVNGITIIGQTSEQCRGNVILTESDGGSINNLNVYPIRFQSSGGKIMLNNSNNGTIHCPTGKVELVSGNRNVIYTTDYDSVEGTLPQGNTIICTANYNVAGLQTNDSVKVQGSRAFLSLYNGESHIKLRNNNGNIELQLEDGTALLSLTNEYTMIKDSSGNKLAQFNSAPASGYTGLFVRYNIDGTTTTKQVKMGAVDSGGSGYRALVIPNTL